MHFLLLSHCEGKKKSQQKASYLLTGELKKASSWKEASGEKTPAKKANYLLEKASSWTEASGT